MELRLLEGRGQVNAPATAHDLTALEQQLGHALPRSLRDLLQSANGIYLSNGTVLYRCDDLAERNATFEVEEYAPGYLVIGDDSGGSAILISLTTEGVYLADQGCMDPAYANLIGDSLASWVAQGCLTGGIDDDVCQD